MLTKLNYVLDHFKKVYRIDNLPVGISYSNDENALIHIKQGNVESLINTEPYIPTDDTIVWKPWKGKQIPFFFGKDNGELITYAGGQYSINQDIIASAFYLLSGWQEFFSQDFDQYGRYPYHSSIQKRLNITNLPIVNYYFDILKTVLEQATGNSITPDTWSGKNYAVCLTHDIDTCESAWKQGSLSAIKSGDFLTPFHLAWKKLMGRDAWFNFNEILDLEQKYGGQSTFFFLATSKSNNNIRNADYDLGERRLCEIQDFIVKSGSEVGIHGSSGTSEDSERLKNEMKRFRTPITGNRFHFLLYNPNVSGRVLDECGLAYDASLGFAEQAGFRNSFCFPFHPWDIKNDKPFQHYEIPLALMDGTLQKHLHLKPFETNAPIELVLEEVRKFNGCMTVLWHNTHFSEFKFKGWKEVYTQILNVAVRDKAAILSCKTMLEQFSNTELNTSTLIPSQA